uniref:Asparagine synthetase [glutamine-hydrolyzing] n=1 Tax=Hemiscolopendra marginata TaxID=943146 RepID=A0A646QFX2_9MYRI
MCGIWAVFGYDTTDLQKFLIANSKLSHRGPDTWRIENNCYLKNVCLGFHRLVINGLCGMQPMRLKSYPHLWLVCNGEIYNYVKLGKENSFQYETECDVEVILHMYAKGGIDFCCSQLDGVFAFSLLDTEKKKVYIARDTFGVRPIFKLNNINGFLGVSSEAKGLIDFSNVMDGNAKMDPISPGIIEEYDVLDFGKVKFKNKIKFHKIGDKPIYNPFVPWEDLQVSSTKENIKKLLKAAVKKRLMAERRIGCLLSGGLDSSLVSALLLQLAKEENISYPIQTFSIGMTDSPDVLAARKVAKHIGSEHHEVIFTPEEATEAIEKVIYHLESYDITTVRASIGMYLVSKYIAEHTDTTVLFSGEGADELAQGYIYFRDAPSSAAGDEESHRLLNDLFYFDVLRADRTTAAHGLELRVPFLDHQFTSFYLGLPADMRQPQKGIEKHLIREAFSDTDLLPEEILWRHKEAFSDGVASKEKSLFIYIQEFVENLVNDSTFKNAASIYPHNTPKTKEAFYYRQVFERTFPNQSHWIPYYWLPRWTTITDPSARYLTHYAAEA